VIGKKNRIDPNGSDKMRPELKRMNERLGYFLHQMDLDNAHIKHAEERIEELEKENQKLEKENRDYFTVVALLKRANKETTEALSDLEQAYSTLKKEYHELVSKHEETQRTEGHHYCDCGAIAYIHYQIDGGKYYCGECFKRNVIKL